MSIKRFFPDTRPTLDLNFAATKRLDPRITYARDSTGTFVGSNGLIQSAAVNQARFDHNPLTGESLGLLVEEDRTNLNTYSEQLDNGVWSGGLENGTVTPNTAIAPDGTLTADKFVPTAGSAAHGVGRTIAAPASSAVSVYVKYAGQQFVQFHLGQFALTQAWATFDILNGVTGTTGGSTISSTITNAGNGWYRCSFTRVNAGTAAFGFYIVSSASAGFATASTGDGTSGIHIWGLQLEAGSFPTSYIPTVASTVTRAQELVSILGSNFTSLYSPNKGTFFVQASITGERNNTSGSALVSLGTTNNDTFAGFLTFDNRLDVGITIPSEANVAQFSNLTGKLLKGATGFDDALTSNAASASAINGNLYNVNVVNNYGVSNTPAAVGGYDRLGIGRTIRSISTYESINGTIARLTYWPTRLPTAQLQALTVI